VKLYTYVYVKRANVYAYTIRVLLFSFYKIKKKLITFLSLSSPLSLLFVHDEIVRVFADTV
jgi:hypothetical protein